MNRSTPRFDSESFLPGSLLDQVTERRVESPELVVSEGKARVRRSSLTREGKLVILAADHPGRGVTRVGNNPVAMGDRHDYLARIVRVLGVDGVDGIMSTPDILDELLILNALLRREGASFLDSKLLIGSMNRGGVSGTVFEMNDRFGAFTAKHLCEAGMDGAKMMFRLDPDSSDSGATIQYCARALRELERHRLPAFLEPLPVRFAEGRFQVIKTAEALIRTIGIATALGDSSRYLWMKVPYVEDYRRVTRSTTCPILMLGGESRGNPLAILRDFSQGLASGSNVRGVLVGRSILFPGERDPAAMAEAVVRLVHGAAAPEEAAESLG